MPNAVLQKDIWTNAWTRILTCYPCGCLAFFDIYEPHIYFNSIDVMLLFFPFTIPKVLHYNSVTVNVQLRLLLVSVCNTGFTVKLPLL